MHNRRVLKYATVWNTILLFVISLFVLPPVSMGAEAKKFSHLTIENGLSHTDAGCTIEDKDGLIWIGTIGGLQSYDGYKLNSYDYFASQSKGGEHKFENRILKIVELNNMLVLGTKSGLRFFDKHHRRYVEPTKIGYDQALEDEQITSIAIDDQQYIWVSTHTNVLVCRYDETSQELTLIKRFDNNIYDNDITLINALVAGSKGVWAILSNSTILHLSVVGNSVNLISSQSFNFKDNTIYASCYNRGRLYLLFNDKVLISKVGVDDGAIDMTNYHTVKFDATMRALNYRKAAMAVNRDGAIWFSHRDGVVEVNNPYSDYEYELHSHSYGDPHSLSRNFIADIYFDSDNIVWISTWGRGVNYADVTPKQFGSICYNPDDKNGLNGQFVKDIELDKSGRLWIATQNYGVDCYDLSRKRVVESYSAKEHLFNDIAIKSIAVSSGGRYVFVAAFSKLCVIDRVSKISTLLVGDTSLAQIINKNVELYSIDIDERGDLWVATWRDGLYVIRHNTNESRLLYHIDENSDGVKLLSNIVNSVKCFGDNIWLATNDGVTRIVTNKEGKPLNATHFRADFTKDDTLSSNLTSCLDVESESVVWVGTFESGLNRMTILPSNKQDNTTCIGNYHSEVFTKESGLPSNDVESIQVDAQSDVWIGGYGLTRLKYPSLEMTSFDISDGLQSNAFKIGSSLCDKQGTLYFGGINGLNYFDPQNIHLEVKRGQMTFTNLVLPNNSQPLPGEHINYTECVELSYLQNSFAIEFSALNYLPSNKLLYRYSMDKLDDGWQYVSRDIHRVSYSSLDYGRYKFTVQPSFDGGVSWDEADMRSVDIYIKSPWWWCLWSQLIYYLLIVAIILVIFFQYIQHMNIKHKFELKELEERRSEENHQQRLQFFTNISHEFRTPLTIIIAAAERLTEYKLDNKQQRLFDSIVRNARSLQSLITQLMDFRKTETRSDVIRAVETCANPFVRNIVEEFRLWSMKQSINIHYEEDQDIKLWLDHEKLTKILWNLISNALKYTEKGGDIFISMHRGRYSSFTPTYSDSVVFESDSNMGECMAIIVRDSGIGITSDSLNKIFDRYFQVASKTSLHLGSGIGLAVAKNMTLSHNGNIIVSSKRNVGTEFIVAIPIDSSYLSDDEKFLKCDFDTAEYFKQENIGYNLGDVNSGEECVDDDKSTMLIVEDNAELRTLLVSHFSHDYRVYSANNGEEGLKFTLANYPDIIISDVMMPKMDGVEMCEQIRQNMLTTSTPIILLTAKSELDSEIKGLESGADLYIPKPFSTKVLELHIKRLLNREEQIKERAKESTAVEALAENQSSMKFDIGVKITNQEDRDFIETLINVIMANLDNSDYSVNDLCNDLAIGRTKLYAKIKDIAGITLGDLIRDIRITRAAELLSTTQMNVTEVLNDVGFSSNSYFSKVFKNRYGVTPSEYMQRN